MAASRKSWCQKLEDSTDLPQVMDIPAKLQPLLGFDRLRVPRSQTRKAPAS
jgi:hypothetical protein